MAVPNDGTNANLSLGSIYSEIDQSDYTAFDAEDLEDEDVSLKGLADGTVSGINIANQIANNINAIASGSDKDRETRIQQNNNLLLSKCTKLTILVNTDANKKYYSLNLYSFLIIL